VALVPEHGLYGTARALRLGYGALKAHVAATRRRPPGRRPAAFVELAGPPAAVREAWTIEIEGAGATVRLRLADLALTDLAEFTRRVVGPPA
jgi:hypothetical protein